MKRVCEVCRDYVECTEKEERKRSVIRGKEIHYTGKTAYCPECGNEVFVSEIRDYNLKVLDKAFREKEELVSVEDIGGILEKYNIGKRPLSQLLGWGEVTLTRYLDGDIPTKQYSDILKRILSDPEFMAEILEENKGQLTDRAYKLCKQALENIRKEKLKTIITTEEKIDHVVKYLLKYSVEITPMALQKHLYWAQGFFKAFFGRFLFNEDCEAWIHGPVYRKIFYTYREFGYNPIEENSMEYGEINLAENEKEILDSIIASFGCYSGKVLENMTHLETPWSQTRMGLRDHEGSDRIIEKELIANYFNRIKSKYDMINVLDIKDYSTDLFEKIYR